MVNGILWTYYKYFSAFQSHTSGMATYRISSYFYLMFLYCTVIASTYQRTASMVNTL